MSRSALLAFCRKLPHVTEDVKWKEDLVFSIGKKMFACFEVRGGPSLGFKVTPENFAMLTRTPGIIPAPYAARFHWIKVLDWHTLPKSALQELICESYQLVFDKLPAGVRKKLGSSGPRPELSRPRRKSSGAPGRRSRRG